MHTQDIHIRIGETVLLADVCRFGLCKQAATRIVTTRSPIGSRVELLCAAHAHRRHELEDVLGDELILTGIGQSPRLASTRFPRIVHQLAEAATRDRAIALQRPALCPACHQPQSAPSCTAREHWGSA
jgi:hypothetical protein